MFVNVTMFNITSFWQMAVIATVIIIIEFAFIMVKVLNKTIQKRFDILRSHNNMDIK